MNWNHELETMEEFLMKVPDDQESSLYFPLSCASRRSSSTWAKFMTHILNAASVSKTLPFPRGPKLDALSFTAIVFAPSFSLTSFFRCEAKTKRISQEDLVKDSVFASHLRNIRFLFPFLPRNQSQREAYLVTAISYFLRQRGSES